MIPTGHPTEPTTPPRWGLGDAAGGWAAANLASLTVGSLVVSLAGWGADLPIWGIAILQLPLWAVMCATVAFAGRVKGGGVVHDFRVAQRPLDIPVGLAIGVLMQFVVNLVYWVLSLVGLDTSGTRETADRLASAAGTSPVGWIVFALIVGLGAPLAEELFYRGLLLGAFRKRGLDVAPAVALTAFLFASAHLQVIVIPGLTLFAVVLGLMVERTDRLGPAIWAHVGFNMTTVVVMFLTRG